MDETLLTQFDPVTRGNILHWLSDDYDGVTRSEILKLLSDEPAKLTDAFYTHLSFGTGGMRGLMGVGTNRVNVYTVRAATQGLANYLAQQKPIEGKRHRVVISHDSRHQGRLFATEAAQVLAGNDIEVYLSPELRPTPWVSFACRHLCCSAGIMLTASHNPPAYNGYKVYWSDGAQVLPPHDEGIVAEAAKIAGPAEVKRVESASHPLIHITDAALEEAYFETIEKLQYYPEQNHREGGKLKIIYTPLHGTGITLVPEAMRRWGFSNFEVVPAQSQPDGNFPTVATPNPEEPKALQLGISLLEERKGDLLLATDPDADRMGVVVCHRGRSIILNGHQIACLCLDHILSALKQQGIMPLEPACIKSLPTTELFAAIAEDYGVECFDVLTGFKYIAALIRKWESGEGVHHQYLFGAEESYGYLIGTYARDKDAVSASTLIAEAALLAKLEGKTLVDRLHHIYNRYGLYSERLLSITFPETKEGKEKMVNAMAHLRKHPPIAFGDFQLLAIEDYQSLVRRDLLTETEARLDFPPSDILLFRLSNQGKLIVRPSGTEPRIKLYGALAFPLEDDVESVQKKADAAVDLLLAQVAQLL